MNSTSIQEYLYTLLDYRLLCNNKRNNNIFPWCCFMPDPTGSQNIRKIKLENDPNNCNREGISEGISEGINE
jgi:hypothetical protein